MAPSRLSARLAIVVILGAVVFAAAYTALSETMGVFFGFVYILAIPFVYWVLKRVQRPFAV